ncbi:MAG: type II toxin-antitoxin system prevent-host-death family antitoxin [Bifidobacteriaceae bacterium]|jgi:prevent-host-death family protein|nr:type II toxin-antitoxin system prevent-host-death family antitoxin [Bifidobacteriaceae bacterium]
MAITMNIQEAKARLSQLVAQAEEGHDVVIARAGRPVVRLEPVAGKPARRLGLFATNLTEADQAESLAPLEQYEVALWSGGAV